MPYPTKDEKLARLMIMMKKASDHFEACMNELTTEDEISYFCQSLSTLCIKTINGVDGVAFKNGFLVGALHDNEALVKSKRH